MKGIKRMLLSQHLVSLKMDFPLKIN